MMIAENLLLDEISFKRMKPINIQLDRNETTRRYPRRVVWKLAQHGSAVFLGVFLALFCIHHDWTGRMSYQEADSALYLEKSATTLLLTSEEYRQPLLQGSSYSLVDGLQWARYGITRHIRRGETIAVTIDRAIPEEIAQRFTESGFFVEREASFTTISLREMSAVQGRKARSWSLNLLNQGRLHDFTTKTSSRLRITESFVQFSGQDRAKRVTSPFNDQNYRALWTSEALPPGFSPFSNIPATTIEIIVFEDTEGTGFRFKFNNANLDIEQLAEIGKQYLLQQQLSTTAWTILDGTLYNELRNDLPINSVINQNDGVLQLTLEQGDRLLRMTQTSDVLVLSNRHISLTTEENALISTCLPRAQQLLFTHLIEEDHVKSNKYRPLSSTFTSPWSYQQLARRGRILRLCL